MVHHVTLTSLRPAATIYYRVHAGKTVLDQEGKPFETAVLATAVPGEPVTVYGQVMRVDGSPAVGAMVSAWVVDGVGSRSEPLTALVDGWGYWVFSMPEVDCANTQLQVEASSTDGLQTVGTVPACSDMAGSVLNLPEAASGDQLSPDR